MLSDTHRDTLTNDDDYCDFENYRIAGDGDYRSFAIVVDVQCYQESIVAHLDDELSYSYYVHYHRLSLCCQVVRRSHALPTL
jgi:hypothetical protein